MVTVLSAQQNQAIYPAYDGFLKNPDGSYTLAFAYFSNNANEMTIAPGANNSFAPTPGDRQQPITFKPGHWRFQCVMVVGPEFDGKMRWTLTYAGITTGTSERMLQSNWNLVEGAPALVEDRLREGAERRVPQSRAGGARARRHGARERSAADVERGAQRRAEPVWQRAGRRPAARQGPRRSSGSC